MLSLDDAIQHCIEIAKENEDQYKNCPMKFRGNYCSGTTAGECAEEYRQLAAYLQELKEYRIEYGGLTIQ